VISAAGAGLGKIRGMTNPGIAAVAAKYAEIMSDVRRLRLELRTAEFNLEHVKVALLLLDPEYPVSDIKPPRRHASPKPQTDRNRMAIDFLRESTTPMTSREIARQVLTAEGNEGPTPQVVDLVAAGIHGCLKGYEKRGAAQIVSREPIRWRLA